MALGAPVSNDRKLAAEVRRLALKELKKIFEGEDEERKKHALDRLMPSLLPRLNELTGEDGEPIKVQIINYAGNYSSAPIQPKTIPDSVS